VHALSGALGIWWLWLGIALVAVSFLALLAVLSVENVGFVIPVTALSYVIGALGGAFFLGERVDQQRWIGQADAPRRRDVNAFITSRNRRNSDVED
jgi:drug/metabolite transporter (DMT)-like permease